MASKSKREGGEGQECLVHIRAELVSLGGAVLLAVCLLITTLFILAVFLPASSGAQKFIALILFVASWVYFANSIIEELTLYNREVVCRTSLTRRKIIPLDDLEAMVLTHQGFNLERGIETIEFKLYGKKTENVALGPCWQHHKLEQFMASVAEVLKNPNITQEIRR